MKQQEKELIDNYHNDEMDDTSLHCPAILECLAGITKEDEEIPYIKVDYEGIWVNT